MNLLQMSISSAIMILAVIVIRALAMNRLPKKAFLALWGVALLRLLVPFTIPSELSIYSVINRAVGYSVRPDTVVNNVGGVFGSLPSISVTTPPVMPPVDNKAEIPWALLIWAVGFAACAIFFAVGYLRCRRRFATSSPVWNAFVRTWLADHPTKRHITVKQSDRIVAPITYGTLHPIILLPMHIDWSNESQLGYILEHEYVHIRRFDGVVKLLLLAALCVHWFNPLVWAMFALANRDIELSCDETVVRSFGNDTKAAYARVLISMEESKSGLMPLCSSFSRNAIEERIRAIVKTKKLTWMSITAAVVVVAGVTVFFATGCKAPNDKAEPLPSSSQVSSEVSSEPSSQASSEPSSQASSDSNAVSSENSNVVIYNIEGSSGIESLHEIHGLSSSTITREYLFEKADENKAILDEKYKLYEYEKQEVLEQINKNEAEIDRILDERLKSSSLAEINGTTNFTFFDPLTDMDIANNYGWLETTEGKIFHTGVDLSAPEGTPIYAGADGEVIFAKFDSKYGNKLVIKHDLEFETVYGHCRSLKVKAGDTVKAGDVVAEVGSTGMATGNHLHFELHQSGEVKDPGIGTAK